MKKYYLIAGIVLLAASPAFAQVKIGAAGAPDGSAMLEVTGGASNNKGLLMPRMTTAQRNAITTPATGLMIYNTTTNEAQVNTGTPASPAWTAATAATGWNTNGNTGTTPATNFVGTTDNQPLSLRTNNTEKVRVTAAGNVGIGTTTPGVKLQITDTGDVAMRIGNSTGTGGNFQLGNGNHGLRRDLTNSGGAINDVAVYTSTGATPGTVGSLYLVSNPTSNGSDSLPLNQFVLKNTGRVGIGTNAPATKLHVDTGSIRISNGPVGLPNHAIEVINDGGGTTNNDNIVISSYGTSTRPSFATQASRGTYTTPANSQAGDNIGNFFFNNRVNGGMVNANIIQATYLGDGTTNKSRLNFISNGIAAMSIDSSQNVGVGTISPIVKLHVVDTGIADIRVTSTTANTGRMRVTLGNHLHGMVRNLSNSGGGPNEVALYTSTGPSSPGSIYLVASPTATDSLNLTQFTLKNTGRVGIGIKDPETKLHVNNGAFRITNTANPGTPAIQVINDGGGNTNGDNIVIQSYGASTLPSIGTFASRGTLAAPANSQSGDNMGNFYTGARVNGVQTTINQIGHVYLGNGTNNKSRMTFATSNAVAMTIDSNSYVGIGTSTPNAKLHVNGGVMVARDSNLTYGNGGMMLWSSVRSGIGEMEFINFHGTGAGGFRFYDVDPNPNVGTADTGSWIAYIQPGSGTYHTPSDSRVKTNVNEINDGLAKVMAMRPVSYDLHTGRKLRDGKVTFTQNDNIIPTIGFIAQELLNVVPEAVNVPNNPQNELYSVSYATVVPVLAKAIQEQQAEIEALKTKNEQLEAANKVTAQLIERVKQMEQMMGIKEIEGTSKVAGK